jgi:hypothetical protein
MGTGLSLGIGIPFRRMGAGIDAQAQAHYDRVIADGGLIPSGLVGVNNFFTTVKAIYGTSDITTAISVGLDAQVLGYKLGAGAGTTAGQAAQKLYSCSGSSGDVEQTTASSQPLLLVHSGANYWWGSGVDGNHLTTPTSTANSNNGNKEIIAQVDCQGTAFYTFASKNNQAYCFFLLNGVFRFNATTDLLGLTQYSATASVATNFSGWVKCTAEFSTGILTVKFFTSADGVTYTQIGSNVTGVGNNFINTGGTLYVGSINGGSDFRGRIHRVTIANSVNGAPVVDFNPNTYNAANSQTQWVSTSGETWTINTGTAATGYKGALVSKTIVQGDGIDDRLTSNVIRTNILTQYLAANPFTNDNSGNSVLIDANNGAWLNSIVAFSSNIGNIMNSFASDLLRSRTPNRLILATSLNNEGVRNSISVNNGAETLNTYSPCPSGNGLNIFSRSGGGTFGNAIINTYISTIGQNNSTIRTAMYNYIRSINNNAF